MKDVINVINILLQNLESDNSLENLIHAVRDLISLIDSHDCLQATIRELSRSKIQDKKNFEKIVTTIVKELHQAASQLKIKIDRLPRLKKIIDPFLFAEIKNTVKFSEYPIEERPRLLIGPFLKLLNSILDCGETEYLIKPYASIASNNERKFIKEITLSDNVKTFYRDAEHFRGKRDMALWNLWDNIVVFHEWTKNGIPNSVFREKLGVFSDNNQIRQAFSAICRHLLINQSKIKEIEENSLTSSPSINVNSLSVPLEKKSETFVITALELFIHPFECQVWIILHHTNKEYVPYFVKTCRDESRGYKFAMDLLALQKGAVLADEDLPVKRNDLGIKGILNNIFFHNSTFNGKYVKLDELSFKISNDKLFDALPKNENRTIPPFPVVTYIEYSKTTA